MAKILDAPGVYFTGVRDLTNYQPNVPGTIGFIPFISKKGEANSIKYITSAQNLVKEYGEPDISVFGKFGQGLMNAAAYSNVSGSLYAMRVLPEDAEYANAYLDLLDLSKEQTVKQFTNLAPESETMDDDMVSKNLGLLTNVKGKQFLTVMGDYLLFFETGKVYHTTEKLPVDASELELLDAYRNSVEADFVYDDITDGSTVTVDGTEYTLSGNPTNITALLDGVDVSKPMMVLLPKAQGDFYNRYFVRFTEKTDEEDRLYLDIFEKDGVNYKTVESYTVSLYPLAKDNQGDSIFIKDVLENYSNILRAEFNYTLDREDAIQSLRETLLGSTIPLTQQDSLIRYTDQLPIEKVDGEWKSIFTEDKKMTFVTDDYADEDSLRELHEEIAGTENTLDSYKGIKIDIERTTSIITEPQAETLDVKYFRVDDGSAVLPASATGTTTVNGLDTVTITGSENEASNITITFVADGGSGANFSTDTLTVHLTDVDSYSPTDIQTLISNAPNAPTGVNFGEFTVTKSGAGTNATGSDWAAANDVVLTGGKVGQDAVTKYGLFFTKGTTKKIQMTDNEITPMLTEEGLISLYNSLSETHNVTFPLSGTIVDDPTDETSPSFVYNSVTYYFREDKSSTLPSQSITVMEESEVYHHSITMNEMPIYKLVEFTSDVMFPLSGEIEYSYTQGIYSILDNGVLRKFDPFGFAAEYVGMISLQNGSDGSLWDPATGKIDTEVATNTLIKAYNGQLDANKDNQYKVTDKFGTYFTLVFDANYPKPVKDAIVNLVDNLRDDCVAILDMEMPTSIEDAKKKRRTQYSYNTKNAIIYDNPYKIYDEYTGAYYWVTPTYAMARLLPSVHQAGFLWTTPAGLRRGAIDGVNKLKYIPANNEELSLLTEDQVNPIIKLPEGYYMWGQRTALKNPSIMQNLYAVMVEKYAYRAINTFLKFYPFEFNTQDTWNDVKAQVSSFMNDLQIQGGVESYKLEVGATDYELKQRMFHVYVEMNLPEIAEKVVFSIGVSN